MAEPDPSPGLSPNSVPVVATSHSPHSHKGDGFTNQPKPFKKDESTSLSVEQEGQVYGQSDAIPATESQPGADDTTVHQETTRSPVLEHSLRVNVHYSLNSSPPDAAAKITAYTPSINTIEVKIEPPSSENCNGDITAYRLQHKELGTNEDWKTYNVPTTKNAPTTRTIDNLQPATSYSIRVAAENSCGSGPFSEPPVTCTTQQAPQPPSAAPTCRMRSTTDTISVAIEPPPHRDCNGDIIAYKVQHRVAGRNEEWETSDVPTAPNLPTTHTIRGVQPATSYSVRVAAVNFCDCGPFCEDECTTQQAPQPPNAAPTLTRLYTTADTIRVEIETPPPEFSVTKYRLNYNEEANGNEGQRQQEFESRIGESNTTFTIHHLHPDTFYIVSIAAVNDAGEGPFSEGRSCRTEHKATTKALWCCSLASGLFLLSLPLLLCLVGFLSFSVYHGTLATGEVLYRNGSVLVGDNGFQTFFQTALFVKTSATSTSGLSFFRHSCDDLPTTNSTVVQVVRKEQLYDTETNIPLYYEYLVDGSTVCFHANITGQRNLTDCAAAIYVLDDWHAYSSAFIDGGNITGNISKYCLNISSTDQPNLPQCFRVLHPGFLFFGAYIPGKDQGLGVELAVIQTVAYKVLYNTSSLKSVCEISLGERTQHCIFDKKVSTSIGRKTCVLMAAEEESTDIHTLSYSVVPNIKDFPHHQNLGTIIFFPVLLIATVVLVIILVATFLYVKCIYRRKRYKRLQ